MKAILDQATNLRCAGKTKAAKKLYQKLLTDSDPKNQIEALNGIALCEKMEHHYKIAIAGFKQAARLAEKIGYPLRLSGLYRDIAITYEYQQKYARADRWYVKAFANLKKYGDQPLPKNAHWGITVGKRGLLYLRWGKLDLAKRFLTEGLAACQAGQADFYALTLQMHLAELAYRKQRYASVISQTTPLLAEAQKRGWDHRVAQIASLRYWAFTKMEKVEKAAKARDLFDTIYNSIDSTDLKLSLQSDWERLAEC